jgi:hypothetical protein
MHTPSRCDIGLPLVGVRRLGHLLSPKLTNDSLLGPKPLVSTSIGEPATDLGQVFQASLTIQEWVGLMPTHQNPTTLDSAFHSSRMRPSATRIRRAPGSAVVWIAPERFRENLGEPYQTIVGHLRHELAPYSSDVLRQEDT